LVLKDDKYLGIERVFDIAKVKLPKEYGIISYGFVAKVAYTSFSIGT
jgi:hypothetical protein